jgi:hypothetical protein
MEDEFWAALKKIALGPVPSANDRAIVVLSSEGLRCRRRAGDLAEILRLEMVSSPLSWNDVGVT